MKKSIKQSDIEGLKEKIRKFVRARDWEKFHKPKDLAIALIEEAAELLSHFRYLSDSEIQAMLKNKKTKKEIDYELVDVLYHLLRLSDVLNVDLKKTLNEKLKISGKKYPISRVKGKPFKYTYYRSSY